MRGSSSIGLRSRTGFLCSNFVLIIVSGKVKEMDREQFLIIGDSFVRRLDYLIESDRYRHRFFRPNLGLSSANVDLIGHVEGANPRRKIVSIENVEEFVMLNQEVMENTDVCCVQVGSNDLLGHFFDRPIRLAEEVLNLAYLILNSGASRVVILPTMFRQGAAAIPR